MSQTAQITSPLMKKERDYWFDNAKAILITAVVVGHLANGLFTNHTDWAIALQKFIYIFHMPAFMIISGRFAKKRIDRGDWVTVINKLVVPYIVLQTLMLLLYAALKYKTSTDAFEHFSYFKPLFGLWYFITIAAYCLISPYIVKHKWVFPVSLIVGLAIGFMPGTLYGGFYRVFTFYPFFLFGYYTYGNSFSFCKKIWFRVISVAFIFVTGLLTLKYAKYIPFDLLCMNKVYGAIDTKLDISVVGMFLMNIARYLAGFIFFFVIMGVTPSKKTFFSYIGTNSSYVYALHLFFIVFLRAVDADYDILRVLTNKWLLLAYCFSGIPMSFILASKPIRKLTGFFVEPKFDIKKIVKTLTDN